MEFLDLRTILVSYALCNLICAIVLFSLWKQNRTRFAGLDLFMSSFLVNFLGILLLALRDIAPDFVSVLIGNVFLIAGVLILYLGLTYFLDRRVNQVHNFVLLGIYILIQILLIYVYPNLQHRIILFSTVISIYCIQITWLLFSIKNRKIRSITGGLGVISILYWLIGIIRIGYELIVPTRSDLFQSDSFEVMIYLLFQLVYIVLTFYLFLMVNRRLFLDLEEDISIRKQAESALESSQEKYLRTFHSSPNSVLITRMSDGKVIEANDQFISLFEYTREEVISSSTLVLKMWANPLDREKVVALMKESGRVKEIEVDGRLKSGKIKTFHFSGEIIKIENEMCMLIYLEDITERKRIDAILKLRLQLWEYSANHTTPELMQKVLDELEKLTKSPIGFFHLMDRSTNSLVLQAWSTRTKNEFCKAEGEGMHYPVKSAGVWCDSVREKRAIIHNDYASLPNRKGMPEGHATVVRELVVPILRDNHVLAVIGIGNKDTDYDQKDVDLVDLVANLAWEIIIENQSEEKILDLNKQLEKLAMIDELTNLNNRRSFFIKGNEEISRAKRYKSPLSVIMLDIDKFKLINDSFGHEYGDMALQSLAEILREHVREVDIIGRLGGEEFGILLPNTDAEHTMILAERLRLAVEKQSSLKKDVQFSFTASFGVAELTMEIQKLDDLLRDADTAMYQAKNQGRNRVVQFTQNGE